MKIYALGGLGADKRTFTYLNLENHELICLDWVQPDTGESLPEYATKIHDLIDEKSDFGLLGVSFGGMIMTEVAKLCNAKFTFLISSVEHHQELRTLYRLAGTLKLDRAVPYKLMVKSGRLVHYLFGVKLMRDKELLKNILDDMDPEFIKWAIRSILSWNNETSVNAIRIHGESDRVLPISMDKIHHKFGKGHFIIVNEAESISEILDSYQ